MEIYFAKTLEEFSLKQKDYRLILEIRPEILMSDGIGIGLLYML